MPTFLFQPLLSAEEKLHMSYDKIITLSVEHGLIREAKQDRQVPTQLDMINRVNAVRRIISGKGVLLDDADLTLDNCISATCVTSCLGALIAVIDWTQTYNGFVWVGNAATSACATALVGGVAGPLVTLACLGAICVCAKCSHSLVFSTLNAEIARFDRINLYMQAPERQVMDSDVVIGSPGTFPRS
jgi:hypothetical protein